MSEPYVGEIRLFGGNFAPVGWALCNGQMLSISQNDALYNLVGTTYGGDGVNTFALPDLRGRTPVHMGQGTGLSPYVIGQNGGTENVTLSSGQLPVHTHAALANPTTGAQGSPAGTVLAGGDGIARYESQAPRTAMYANSIAASGQSLPHDNIQPFGTVTYIIALYGIYPSPS